MTAEHKPSNAERVKSFLWFAVVAVLIALAIILWIRKATTPRQSLLEKSTEVAEQERSAGLVQELRAAVAMIQETDAQRRREGLAKIEQIAKQNPEFIPAQDALVRVALILKENVLAERTARELVTRFPDAPDSHGLMALVALATSQWPTAETELKKALELNEQQKGPQLWNLHGLLAEAYLKQHKTQEADAELRRAVDINLPQAAAQIARTSMDLSERLGIVLLERNKAEELEPAYLLLTGVATHAKEDADAQYYAAEASLRKGQGDEARQFLAAAEKLKPTDPRLAKLKAAVATAPTTTRATTGPTSGPAASASAPAQ